MTADRASACPDCGWPFDAESRATGECALCEPPAPAPHTPGRVRIAILVTVSIALVYITVHVVASM